MRKLGRMVRRVLTAVSLLLFVAVLAAWIFGRWGAQSFGAAWESHWMAIEFGEEDFGISTASLSGAAVQEADGFRWTSQENFEGPGARYRRELTSDYSLYSVMVFQHPEKAVRRFASAAGTCVGYGRIGDPTDMLYEFRCLAFPCWMAAIVFGALPSWRGFVWWRGVRRRRLASLAGRCGVCGYDLRASPQRCPECGLDVARASRP